MKNCGFTMKNGAFTMKNGSFTMKNGGFTIKNGGFTIKNGAFTIKNGGFTMKQLVNITPISLWFMVDISIIFMGFINQRSHHWGAPPCMVCFGQK